MHAAWIPMAFFALAGAISPGPVNLMASSLGARQGFWRTLPHVAGASLSYCGVILLMGAGMQAALSTYPALTTWTRYAGALYLLYLATRIAMAPAQALDTPNANAPGLGWRRGVLQGVLIQSLNPKAWLVALSGVSLFVPHTASAAGLWLFCAVSGVICFVSIACWAALGTLVRRWLQQPRYQRIFNHVLALLLLLTVLDMLDWFERFWT